MYIDIHLVYDKVDITDQWVRIGFSINGAEIMGRSYGTQQSQNL